MYQALLKLSAPCRVTALDDVLLHQILSFASARDLEALVVASRVFSRVVHLRYASLWRHLFAQRWTTLNFPLDSKASLVIDLKLRSLFPKGTSESRMFQVLTHAIVPVPSYADLDQTARCRDYSDAKHGIHSLHEADTRPSRIVRFAFNGNELGDDRSVRANVPFPPGFHVAVFQRRKAGKFRKALYQIGLVASSYFEIQILHRERKTDEQEQEQIQADEALTSLGLVSASFPLVGRQPGWNQDSYGYHGDDGRYYCQTTRGRLFGPRFSVNDIVGCGVRQNVRARRSHVFFACNGEELARMAESSIDTSSTSWFPAVGVDSYNEVRVNFGQETFAYDAIVDEMLAECDLSILNVMDLPWYDIQEYRIECLVWRCQQGSTIRARADFEDWEDADSGNLQLDEEIFRNKWGMGILTRRQQNRLALS